MYLHRVQLGSDGEFVGPLDGDGLPRLFLRHPQSAAILDGKSRKLPWHSDAIGCPIVLGIISALLTGTFILMILLMQSSIRELAGVVALALLVCGLVWGLWYVIYADVVGRHQRLEQKGILLFGTIVSAEKVTSARWGLSLVVHYQFESPDGKQIRDVVSVNASSFANATELNERLKALEAPSPGTACAVLYFSRDLYELL